MNYAVDFPRNQVVEPCARFLEAVQHGSNREIDWLCVASEMPSLSEREYCLRRALYINPRSRQVREALRQVRLERAQNQSSSLVSRLFGRTATD